MRVRRHEQIALGMTVIEMTDKLKARGADLASATLNYEIFNNPGRDGFYFEFFSPETDEEWEQRLKEIDEADAKNKARRARDAPRKELAKKAREEAELAEYERLKAKFG